MKITHYKCSSVLKYNGYRPDHCNRLGKLLNLKPYRGKKADGCFFFGCYNKHDHAMILTNEGPTILYWGGTDITKARANKWKFSPNILHVVGNKRCKRELEAIGIHPIVRPICEISPTKFNLEPLGKSVFVYMPYRRRGFYGFKIVKKVAKRFPDTNFILTRWGRRAKPFKNSETHHLKSFEDLKQLYRRSFCCIRPVKHDGHPQTLIEMGLMGRRSGWTFGIPIEPACVTVSDYAEFINREMERKTPDKAVRRHYLKTVNNFDFLEESYGT